jgi:hypothetical protein
MGGCSNTLAADSQTEKERERERESAPLLPPNVLHVAPPRNVQNSSILESKFKFRARPLRISKISLGLPMRCSCSAAAAAVTGTFLSGESQTDYERGFHFGYFLNRLLFLKLSRFHIRRNRHHPKSLGAKENDCLLWWMRGRTRR